MKKKEEGFTFEERSHFQRNGAIYDDYAVNYIKQLREAKGMTYNELRRRLRVYNVTISETVLSMKIRRGTYSFSFAMKLLAAMDVTTFEVPVALGVDHASPSQGFGWVPAGSAKHSNPPPSGVLEADRPDHLE